MRICLIVAFISASSRYLYSFTTKAYESRRYLQAKAISFIWSPGSTTVYEAIKVMGEKYWRPAGTWAVS